MFEPVEAIAAFGKASTLTTTGVLVAKQPLAFVAVTVYVPEVVIVLAGVVIVELDQAYDVPPEAVSVTDPP
jgi:hypothetical protein